MKITIDFDHADVLVEAVDTAMDQAKQNLIDSALHGNVKDLTDDRRKLKELDDLRFAVRQEVTIAEGSK